MANERLLILGGNSFLGLHLTRDLAAKYNTTPTYLTNRPSDFNFVRCNLLSKPDLHSLGQFDYVIQYSSIIAGSNKKQQNLEMVRNAVEYANTTQAKYIYISSSQVNFTIDSDYRQSKIEAERLIQEHSANFVIIRPSAPYGSPLPFAFTRQQPFHVLANLVSRLPVVPVIGNGQYLRQPVHVTNLNALVEKCLTAPTRNRVYEIGGPKQLTFNAIIDIISMARSKHTFKLHLPNFIFRIASHMTNFIDAELVNAVRSDEQSNNETWQELGGLDLIPFEQGVTDLFG